MTLRGEYWWVYWRPDGLDWARCAAGEPVPREEGRCRDWEQLPAPAGAQLVLCVPGERVRVHRVSLPVRHRRRFLAALPFALEEQLLRDPAAYHFVPLATANRQEETAVAVIEKEHLSAWLQEIEARGWRLRLLLPDYLAIAAPGDGTWLLDVSAVPMLLRRPRGQGGAVLGGEPGVQLPGSLVLCLEQGPAPALLRVRTAGGEQAQQLAGWAEQMQDYGIDLELETGETSRHAWLARQPLPGDGNLLAGEFAPAHEGRQWTRRLVPAAGLAAALFTVLALQWFIQGARIQTQHKQLQQDVEAVYRQAFPDARNLVDPRYQMEQRLRALREQGPAGGGRDLLVWLERLAPILTGEDDYRLQGLSYDEGSLTLDVSVPDYESLERLQSRLAGAASVEVENAELRDGRVHGRLRVEGRS